MSKYPRCVYSDTVSGECYTEIHHPCGLTVYVYPKALSTSYAMFTTRYGSLERTFRAYDGEIVTVPDGVAHFLEHKLFEEEDGSDVFERFAALGANANAFTSNDMTSYLFSTTSSVYEPLGVLLSFVMKPYFTKENVEKEMGIIGQEIDMYLDRPMSRLFSATLEALYRNHNVRVNVAGTKETIKSITPEILYRAYRTFYHPSNMILTVVGAVEEERVMALVDESFGKEKREPLHIERFYPEEDEEVDCERVELSMQISKPMFSLAFKDLASLPSSREKQKRAYTVDILLRLLFSRSAPLYNLLYTEGLISDTFSAMHEWLDSCAHTLIVGEGDEPNAVFEKIESILSDIPEEMLKEDDFWRVKKAMYAENIRIQDSTEEISCHLTDAALRSLSLWDAGECIREITYEDVYTLAKSYFKNKKPTHVVIYPNK